jgi:hypothetical protein
MMAKNSKKTKKVVMTREEAIDRLLECWADYYSDDPHQAFENIMEIYENGMKGYRHMTSIELIQELEGSVFYGENVEITIRKEIGDGEVI